MNLKSPFPQEEYRFGNCILRSGTRELLRDGQVQKIERRTFDLIHYLLRQEGRVVGKDELLENVWSNRYVTDSVIAQSIMKARKALGITGREEGPIRTVHRVGYRFVGELQRAPQGASGGLPAPHRRAPAVCWLPTEVDGSVASQPWVRTGLISLATHMLRSNGIVVHHASTDAAQAGVAAPGIDTSPVALVHTRMRQVDGLYELRWRLVWDRDDHEGSAEGGSPAELVLRAAVEVALLMRMTAACGPDAGADAQPWRDLLRLQQLCDNLDTRERHAPLEALLKHLPPDAIGQYAECLLILAERGEPATALHAGLLTQMGRAPSDAVYTGWGEACLALHALYQPDREKARAHAAQAVALWLMAPSSARVARGLTLAAHVLATVGEVEQAEHALAHARRLCNAPASRAVVVWQELQCAELALLRGDVSGSGQVFGRAVIGTQKLGIDGLSALALTYHAMHQLARGDLAGARQQLQSAQSVSDHSGWPRARVLANLQLGLLCARMGDRDELGRCIDRLAERRLRGTWLGGSALAWLRARASLLDGRPGPAIAALEQSAERLSGFGIWHAEDNWLVLGHALLCTGQRSRALALLERLQRRSRLDDQAQCRAAALGLEALIAQSDGRALLADTLMHRAQAMAHGTLLGAALAEWMERWQARGDAGRPAAALPAGIGPQPTSARVDQVHRLNPLPTVRMPLTNRPIALAPAGCAVQEPSPGGGDCWPA